MDNFKCIETFFSKHMHDNQMMNVPTTVHIFVSKPKVIHIMNNNNTYNLVILLTSNNTCTSIDLCAI